MIANYGETYTKGNSFRARAEERQRRFRAETLGLQPGRYGHYLRKEDADAGRNFVHEDAYTDALDRQAKGKGVSERTFENMLSSQAMCFNIFAPLRSRRELAAIVLAETIQTIRTVNNICIEYTPPADVFYDQTGRGGVDCDLLIEGTATDGETFVLVIETKFVETEFSICGFRKPGRTKHKREMCAENVIVRHNRDACLYQAKRNYAYWLRSDEHALLHPQAIPERGCPFAGQLWQLWVNYALAHEIAKRNGARHVYFGVCAPANNEKLLQRGMVLERFRSLLSNPDRAVFLDVDSLIYKIKNNADHALQDWVKRLLARYAII